LYNQTTTGPTTSRLSWRKPGGGKSGASDGQVRQVSWWLDWIDTTEWRPHGIPHLEPKLKETTPLPIHLWYFNISGGEKKWQLKIEWKYWKY